MSSAPPIPPRAPSQFKTLRKLFLIVFLRGHSARGLSLRTAPRSIARRLGLSLVVYAVLGLMAFAGLVTGSVFYLSLWMHAMTFFMVGFYVSSSSGEVLFNAEEADILLHRPVLPRNLLLAKAWVLTEVSLYLAVALNLVALVVGAFIGNLAYPIVHLFSLSVEAMLGTGCAILAYQLCLRWFGRRRLESIMTMMQVLLSVCFLVLSQSLRWIMPYLDQMKGSFSFSVHSIWLDLLPPAWFASLDDAVAGKGGSLSWVLGGVGMAVTALVLWLALSRMAGTYERGVQALTESQVWKERGPSKAIWRLASVWPLSLWLRTPAERASFGLTAAYLSRDRDIKLRLYPALASFLVMPVILIIGNPGRIAGHHSAAFDAADSIASLIMVGIAAGYLANVPMTCLSLMRFSQQWRATEIFRIAPSVGPQALQRGAQVAVVTFMVLPPLIVVAALVGWFFGPAAMWLIIPGLLTVPLFARAPAALWRMVPFSMALEEAKAASRGCAFMVASLLGMVIGVVSAFAWSAGLLAYVIAAESMVVLFLVLLADRTIKGQVWEPE